MAFTYTDKATGKEIFDIATANVQVQSVDGQTKVDIVKDGKLVGVPAAYNDVKARNAIKTKTQVNALMPSVATDVATPLVDLNKVVAALKV